MRQALLLFCALSTSIFAEWTVLENCKLVRSESNDGDSFLVECSVPYRGETQHRVRLYFVDTAETSSNSDFMKKRLKEQSEYWGQDDPDFALRMGLRAQQIVQKMLRSNFTVYTRGEYAPSMGRPRYYATVFVKDRWLDEILVEDGLVRIHGKGAHLPDGINANTHRSRLRQLERSAKAAKRNGWFNAVVEEEAPAAFEPHDAISKGITWIYSAQDGRKVTVLPAGTEVTVVAPAEKSRMRIRFEQNGKVYEGLCDKRNLIE